MSYIIYPTAKIVGNLTCNGEGDIDDFCFINGDVALEDGVHIAIGCRIIGRGKVKIDKGSTLAPGVVLYTTIPELKKGYSANKYGKNYKLNIGEISIGKNVFVGANSVIGPCKIADDVLICSNSFVNKDCEITNGIYAGSPIKLIGEKE